MSVLPNKIKQLRLDKGWTQERLALVTGLSYRTIQRIERDGRCALDSKIALSSAFGIPLLDLSNESQNLLDKVFDLTLVQDANGVYITVNSKGLKSTSISWNSIVGKHYRDVLSADLSQRVSEAMDNLNAGADTSEFEWHDVQADEKRYFHAKMIKVNENSFLSVVTEVSRQKTVEQSLLKNEALLSLVSDTLKTGAWELDVASMNSTWTKQVYSIHELDERPITVTEAISFYPPSVRLQIQTALEQLIESGIPYDLDVPFVTAKGTKLWVRVVGMPIYANEKVVKVSGIIQDITHLKIA
jgi:two-component system sensor histidine kinase/response regulator